MIFVRYPLRKNQHNGDHHRMLKEMVEARNINTEETNHPNHPNGPRMRVKRKDWLGGQVAALVGGV
tara:strand:+ start:198 stop:395 length:198 start_codon:yes stop_codon:yes gene_type:complete